MTIALGGVLVVIEPPLISRSPEVKRLRQILKLLISVVLVSSLWRCGERESRRSRVH